ncbi:MAG: ABC transporter permease subunit [Candidatus Hodarchaeales archaeon]|jgi:ABC-type Na+ efflux pump permease subunit
MTSIKQLSFLIKQELRSATRTRYVIFAFILAPIVMWSLQGGIQVITRIAITSGTETSGETLYITNGDLENNSFTELDSNFTLPFNFDGIPQGTNITKIKLSKFLIATLQHSAEDNTSSLYGINLITEETYSEVLERSKKGKIKYWFHIPTDFSTNYNETDVTSVELNYLTTGLLGPSVIQARLQSILSNQPFTIVRREKISYIEPKAIILEGGEESEGFDFGVGFASFLAIIIAVMVPAPFISTSFAGEREKKTMEALLALPMSRRSILIGKLSAGMVLIGVFTLTNIIGMFLFNFIMDLAPTFDEDESVSSILAIDLNLVTILTISVTLMLSAFIAIGIGISIASLTKDVRTSESTYNLVMMIPAMVIGLLGMFIGVPESLSDGIGPAYLLYLIPWSHTIALFQKISSPTLYNYQSLTGFGLIGDIIFHLSALFITIAIIITIASKIFEREGIVS